MTTNKIVYECIIHGRRELPPPVNENLRELKELFATCDICDQIAKAKQSARLQMIDCRLKCISTLIEAGCTVKEAEQAMIELMADEVKVSEGEQ